MENKIAEELAIKYAIARGADKDKKAFRTITNLDLYNHTIECFEEGYSQALQQPKWIDPNELLPNIGRLVMTYGVMYNEYRIVFYDGLELCFDFWQPLPPPPTNSQNIKEG